MGKKRKRIDFTLNIVEIANGYIVEPSHIFDVGKRLYFVTLEEAVETCRRRLARLLRKHGGA